MLAAPIVAGTAFAPERFMIVNADDLGPSAEIDRGIFEAHDGGIVTSASVLVDAPDAEAAIRQARQRPKLVVLGVHVAFDSRGKRLINVEDLETRSSAELDRQIETFMRG